MIKRNSILDYLMSVMMIYSISVISLLLFAVLFGEDAKEMSTIFQLGNQGLAVETMLQFLILAFLVAGGRWFFFSDKIIKNMSIAFRSVLMFLSVIISTAVFIYVFQWFPVNMALPWLMFFLNFALYSTVAVILSVWKEKNENKKMQEALERLNGDGE